MFPVPTIMDKKSSRHTHPPADPRQQRRLNRNKRKSFACFVENAPDSQNR
jgi:hypothetical protein